MSLDISIKDYVLSDLSKFTSRFFNDTTDSFLKNILSLYKRFQRLSKTHSDYKYAAEKTINWLTAEINNIVSSVAGKIIKSGYLAPDYSDDIQVDSVYGQLSLAEEDIVSKIPLVENEYGESQAIASCEIQESTAATGPWADLTDLRHVINGNNDIWCTELDPAETDAGFIYLKVKTTSVSESDNASYITVFPLMGTKIREIYYNGVTGPIELFDTAWPVKIHRKIENYTNEIIVKLQGKLEDGKYIFSIRDIGIFKCDYAMEGTFSYDLDMGTAVGLSSILLDDPYIVPIDLAENRPFVIKIKTQDDSIIIYDTSGETADVPSTYPLEQSLLLDVTKDWKIEVKLEKIENVTPVITGITLDKIE